MSEANITANSPLEAIRVAAGGTVDVAYKNTKAQYAAAAATIGASAAERKPFVAAQAPVPYAPGVWRLALEDLQAGNMQPLGADWDYNDRYWFVRVTEKRAASDFDLDVNANGTLTDAVDRAANYLPGYAGAVAVLSANAPQTMNVIAEGLVANSMYTLSLRDASSLPGFASNATSAQFPNGAGDADFVLSAANATTEANGRLVSGIQCRDFGGRATVVLKDADGDVVGELAVPKDTDGDTLPDKWEDAPAPAGGMPADFTPFDKSTAQSVAGVNDAARDDDLNEGGAEGGGVGDRLPAFDEYRGFNVAGTHRRTNPAVKQLFVYSPDNDPFLAAQDNADGLNRDASKGPALGVGAYANDLDAEILLISAGEFDGADGRLGDVNFNSPAPHGGIKQKYVWVVTSLNDRVGYYGLSVQSVAGRRGPNVMGELPREGPDRSEHGGKVATVVNLGMVRTGVAFVDGDGTTSRHSGKADFTLLLARGNGGLAADPLRDPTRHLAGGAIKHGLYYFTAADKVRWRDGNGDGHWDRGDDLWIDRDGDGKYSEGDARLFDHDLSLEAGTAGVLVDQSSEFRFARRFGEDTAGPYVDGDYIFTTYFDRNLYTQSRDHLIAHEAVGHPTMLPHDPETKTIMFEPGGGVGYTASGVFYLDTFGSGIYIDPPAQFKDADQDEALELRE